MTKLFFLCFSIIISVIGFGNAVTIGKTVVAQG